MIEIDDSQVVSLFASLSGKDQKKAMKTALRKSAQILVKRTKANLKQVVKILLKNQLSMAHLYRVVLNLK